jgi:SNF2 family DNA or RNA helicase
MSPSEVVLALRDGGRNVHLSLGNADGAARRQLEHTLLLAGAEPRPGGFVLPVLGFRRGAVEIARLLRRLGAPVRLEAEVEQLLVTQLDEIRARRDAEGSLALLTRDAVDTLILAAGRFTRTLTERQRDNLCRLLALRHGANFSVPGAGKTATLLAAYEASRQRDGVEQLLVVAPKNAFISWEEEVDRCYELADRPVVVRMTGGARGVEAALDRSPEITLITYQLLPNVLERIKTWAARRPTQIALDESHRVKAGYAGITATAALDLAGVAIRRDILSGTPLPHSPEDLRPQFDFLWPGQRILPDLRLAAEAPAETLAEVERAVRPLYVRTTKQELELPELQLRPVVVELGPLQKELYGLLRSEAARSASSMRQHDRRFFRLLGRHVVRLLQAAVNPMLLTQGELVARTELEPLPEGSQAWELLRELARFEQPAKIGAAIERAEQIVAEGDKVLIWTQFVMNVLSLEKLLAHHGAVVLYGAIPTGEERDPDTREGRIRRFHDDPDCKVMIANPAAAGEGISLHIACHRAIYLDRSFNAAHYLQSVDRIHRLGLPADVRPEVEILEARGTIDSRVAIRLLKKIEAMATILNDHGLAALAYDPADVEEDFAAGIEPEDIEEILDHVEAPEDE